MSSTNPYANKILETGIFKNLKKFEDLESRIEKTKSIGGRGVETTKGDIFEVFIEALLNVNKKYIKTKVYPSFSTPSKIKNKLNLSLKKTEMGFDGVFEDNDHLSTYQVKFRNKLNGSLTWRDLSTFIGVSEKAKSRHLFTNIDKVAEEFSNKPRVIITSRKDLITLKEFEFREIENWLYKKSEPIKKHKPEIYQLNAIKDITKELKVNDRATAILACGTGKTNIGLWSFERLKPKITVIFVPSIALVKQIRADWLEQISLKKISSLQVCSFKETTFREDSLKITKKDIDFETTTDPFEIKKFIKRNKILPKIIFSTYQSSKVLSQGLKSTVIDLAIFDEAHRTARIGKSKNKKITGFNLPLYDENIRIKKRLFMTATRRISNPNKIYNTGDTALSLSMDNTELYGNVCHSLSFREAAKLKCIAKFKIILSFVTSDEVDRFKRKKSSTIVNDSEIFTQQVAKQIAIKKAVKKYKISKIFTFHNTVNRATSFTKLSDEGIKNHLKDFYTASINGKMRLNERESIMGNFKDEQNALLSNARCLVEGVDVPSVGMVCFLDNKNSEIDIVQAAGRALRNRGQKKEFGYILVPVFVEKNKNEKISDALERTNYENVAQILKAMKEHDSEIAQIINQVNYEIRSKKGVSDKRLKKINEFIEGVNENISEKILTKSIITKSFAYVQTKWEERINQLQEFKIKYGHVNIFFHHKDFRDLYKWVQDVRYKYHKGKLYNFQISELEKIGFKWVPGDNIDTSNLVTKKWFSKTYNLSRDLTLKLIQSKKIKFVGERGIDNSAGLVKYYKKISKEELLKALKIDILPIDKGKLLFETEILKKFKITKRMFDLYCRNKNIKPVAKTLLKGGNLENGIAKGFLYKKINENIRKKIGITLKSTDGLISKGMLISKFNKKLPHGSTIGNLIKSKKIVPVGFAWSATHGVNPYFKNYSLKEIEKIIGFISSNSVSIKYYLKLEPKTGIISRAIKRGIINKIGKSVSGYDLYNKLDKKEFLEKIKVITPDNNEFTVNQIHREISNKLNVSISLPKFRKIFLKKFKPLGKKKFISGWGDNIVYKKISNTEIKELLGIDVFDPKNLLTPGQITTIYKIEGELLNKALKMNIFPYMGYAYFESVGKSKAYKKIPKSSLEKKLNFRYDTSKFVYFSEIAKKFKGGTSKVKLLEKNGLIQSITNRLHANSLRPVYKPINEKEAQQLEDKLKMKIKKPLASM